MARVLFMIGVIAIGMPSILYGIQKFNANFPTHIMCGKIISTSDDAIHIAAKMISNWPANKENLLGKSSVADYIDDFGNCCSASPSKSIGNNWMVTIILLTRCGYSIENIFQVNVCGGRSWSLGSTPSSSQPSDRVTPQAACY